MKKESKVAASAAKSAAIADIKEELSKRGKSFLYVSPKRLQKMALLLSALELIPKAFVVLLFCFFCFSFTTVSANAQETIKREGNTFISTKTAKKEPTKTEFQYVDGSGFSYPIYVTASGACFVYKVSKKTGKEYKYYLKPEICEIVCKELGIEYKRKK